MTPTTVLNLSEDNMRLAMIAFSRANGFSVPDHAALKVCPEVSMRTGRQIYTASLSWEQTATQTDYGLRRPGE